MVLLKGDRANINLVKFLTSGQFEGWANKASARNGDNKQCLGATLSISRAL